MKAPSWLEFKQIAAELRSDAFFARSEGDGVEIPIQRGADGRLTPECAEGIAGALRKLAGGKSWFSRVRVICAIPSRGLIVRPLGLPAAPPAAVPGLLQLQIESEFPLPPDALAWGWIPRPTAPGTPAGGRQEVLVAAVRKEVTEELAAILSPVAAEVVFTPAALARAALVPADTAVYSLLDIGPAQSEFTVCEPGAAPAIRLLPWGENPLPESSEEPAGAGASASADSVKRLVAMLPEAARSLPLFLSGKPAISNRLRECFAEIPEFHGPVQSLGVPAAPGQTAAIAGIHGGNGGASTAHGPWIELRTKPAEIAVGSERKLPRRPMVLAAALLFAVLLFPYAEALLFQPALARRIAVLKARSVPLGAIDRELSFLQYLEQNQAPHLDATFVIAQATPQGARIETLNMNRQGEVSISGWLRDPNQLGELRLKLVNSGFFSTVVVEDQSPTPDRQRINFRINARWKDAADRAALNLGPAPPDPGSAKPGVSNLVAGPSSTPQPPPVMPQ
ncbi:MAG: hypothetical protein KIT22_04855 [Verrucomicrobiae bacterium]|nr:hypothetical protein [Verrucomicrobiae bacterium]